MNKSMGKVIDDTFILTDLVNKSIGMTFGNSLLFSDSVINGINKSLSDTLTFSDYFDRIVAFYRILEDNVILTDIFKRLLPEEILKQLEVPARTFNFSVKPRSFEFSVPPKRK